MLRFYWKLLRRTPILLWKSAKQWDAIAGIVSLCLLGLRVSVEWLPWWVIVAPIGILFLYGLIKANYETFQEIEADKAAMKKNLAGITKRKAVKDLLGNAVDEGKITGEFT